MTIGEGQRVRWDCPRWGGVQMGDEKGNMANEGRTDGSGVPEGGPAMLALSTFRHSEEAIEKAMALARQTGDLVIAYVADKNLARYLIGTDVGLYPGLKEKCEEELLREHEERGRAHVAEIEALATETGVGVRSYVRRGRFALVCLEIASEVNPSVIVTTRSKRPRWVKTFFGAPVDYLTKHVECPVEEA
jgi:nucleotide-binding universal stress UspA family protein